MTDGTEHEIQALNVDLVAWDRERAKHKWPLPADAPFVWLNFLAWHALTKTQGILPAMTLREFETSAAEVSSPQPDAGDEDVGDVDPTNRDREPE